MSSCSSNHDKTNRKKLIEKNKNDFYNKNYRGCSDHNTQQNLKHAYYDPYKNKPQFEALKHIEEVSKINEPKTSKKEIIRKLSKEGKVTEVLELKKLWRL